MTRIFVTGTGRCGTVTFSKAAAHCENFTVGHETRVGSLGERHQAWDYDDGHIEVSAQLVISIPILRQRYPDAKWVHLVRDRLACAESLAVQCQEAIDAFSWVYLQRRVKDAPDVFHAALAYYDCTVTMIDAMLPGAFRLQLESVKQYWQQCWDFMGCQGDFPASLAEWNIKHNARG